MVRLRHRLVSWLVGSSACWLVFARRLVRGVSSREHPLVVVARDRRLRSPPPSGSLGCVARASLGVALMAALPPRRAVRRTRLCTSFPWSFHRGK